MKFKSFSTTMTGFFTQGVYGNGNTAVEVKSWEPDGQYWEPYAKVSVNTDLALPADEFVAKNYSENAGLPEQFVAQGYFADTGRKVQCGYVECPVYRITDQFRAGVGKVPEA